MSENSISWDGDALVLIDQRALPGQLRLLRITTVDGVIEAIATLAVRGAPAIGVAGAYGVAIAARTHPADEAAVRAEAQRIAQARPTAVNLAWGVRQALQQLAGGPEAVLAAAHALLEQDGRVNRAAAEHAADLVRRVCPDRPLRILTHCNTGRLATTAFGTALGAIRVLAAREAVESVLVDETRPLLQGARLTAWELAEAGIPHRLTIDSAAAWAMATGQVDCVLVGADRITADGSVANKIGTYAVALAAHHHGIPFVVVAPESTRDPDTATGAQIVVEQRAAAEITEIAGTPTAPAGTAVFNPAFDVTPPDLVTAVVTENGVVHAGAPGASTGSSLGSTTASYASAGYGGAHSEAGRAAGGPPGAGDATGPSSVRAGTRGRDAFAEADAEFIEKRCGAVGSVGSEAPAGGGADELPTGGPGSVSNAGSSVPRAAAANAAEVGGDTPADVVTDGRAAGRSERSDTGGVAERITWAPGAHGAAHITDAAEMVAAEQITGMARQLYERGWMPGTAGNISVRLGEAAMITGSGLSKGELESGDVVRVRIGDGAHLGGVRRASAETAIHTAIYRASDAGAVVHVHCPYATAVSVAAGSSDVLRFSGYELIKGLGAAESVAVPVVSNHAEVARIGARIEQAVAADPQCPPVVFIAGHGITAWGADLAAARDRAECLEALCELVTVTGRREIGAPSDREEDRK